ncbi:MAG: packaged DNA stabilization protein, partial [Hyphomicrobiales bacterium]|nr:packaged DNA stabilization protein [Hyphomicrobiales bacterium]
MAKIVFPVSHFPGMRASEGAGRLINCYAEPIGEGGRATAVRHRSPGLVNFGTTIRSGFRGMIEIQGNLYASLANRLVRFSSAGGAATDVGVLNGTKKGFFARNNAVTPDRWFVDPDGNIAIFTTSSVTNAWPDVDLPAVNSTCSVNGYGVFTTGSGQAWATDLNSTAVNALSFGTAQSKPDGLLRCVEWSNRLYLCGTQTIEIWTDQGLSPFPFAKSDVIPRGLAGPYCITGFEDSFSKGIHIIGDDNSVYAVDGISLTKISTPDLDGAIEGVSDKTTLEMCSYISRGHSFIQITNPAWTWVYNINNQKWHSRSSYLIENSRITQSYYAFSKWLCGDSLTGNVQQITNSAQQEIDEPLVCEVWSAPVQDFPQRSRGGSAFFDFAVGVGNAEGEDPIATDPGVEISYSIDGGQTFSIPRVRKLGRQSNGKARVRVNQIKA